MTDTITVTGGSGTDSLTVSDTITLDLGDYGAAQPALTSVSLPALTLDDLMSTSVTSVTLPNTYTITNGGTGTTWTTTGTSGYTWSKPPTTVTIDGNGLNMEKGTDIKIGGKSLTEAIEKIEERLGILKPNPELEERWEQLRELRKQYNELEKDLLEKEKIMKILKET